MRGKFVLKKGYTSQMPTHFFNMPYNKDNRVVYSDVLMISLMQETDLNILVNYVPPEFEVLDGDIQWGYFNCRGVDFMSNGEYRILQAAAHVRYGEGADAIEGWYPLAIFEDDPYPILGGREQDGMPKVFADISVPRHVDNHWFAAVSLYSETLFRVDFREEEEAAAEALKERQTQSRMNAFGFRQLPFADREGYAYKDFILYPQESHIEKLWLGTGKVTILPPDPWYKVANLSALVAGLATLPCKRFYGAVRAQTTLRLCVSDSRTLSR